MKIRNQNIYHMILDTTLEHALHLALKAHTIYRWLVGHQFLFVCKVARLVSDPEDLEGSRDPGRSRATVRTRVRPHTSTWIKHNQIVNYCEKSFVGTRRTTGQLDFVKSRWMCRGNETRSLASPAAAGLSGLNVDAKNNLIEIGLFYFHVRSKKNINECWNCIMIQFQFENSKYFK